MNLPREQPEASVMAGAGLDEAEDTFAPALPAQDGVRCGSESCTNVPRRTKPGTLRPAACPE
jgi:hypothetical protein